LNLFLVVGCVKKLSAISRQLIAIWNAARTVFISERGRSLHAVSPHGL
jgi:hypothetical protein